MDQQKIQKPMTKTLPNGDVITTETIADKIRRVAKHPSVIRNRRLLKAMHHITQREDAVMRFTNSKMLVNGGTKEITAVVATIAIDSDAWGAGADDLGEKIVMFPLNSFDQHTGEPPTIRE